MTTFARGYSRDSRLHVDIEPWSHTRAPQAVEPGLEQFACTGCGKQFAVADLTRSYTSFLFYCWPCDELRMVRLGQPTEKRCGWCGRTEPVASFRTSTGQVSKQCARCARRGAYAKEKR